MFSFINPWNFTDPEDMPEIPELSEKGFKILVGVGIACALGCPGCATLQHTTDNFRIFVM